jgi:large subunit ribosomal protein L29
VKADKIRELDDKELQTQTRDMQEQMFRLRFQIGMGQTDGIKKLRMLKKDRARMLGELRQREIRAARQES